MTTRRAKVVMPIPRAANGSTTPTSSTHPKRTTSLPEPRAIHSPLLPTLLEAVLLSIYPGTLFLGSLFSTLNPLSRAAPYSATSQAHHASSAPSYFAKKSNVFNVYFVKIGWFWITLAFLLFTFTHRSLGPPLSSQLTKRRLQALARYACITLVWILVTQWCLGPPIIDRSFRWTGGQCSIVLNDDVESQSKAEKMGVAREAFTHAACKVVGGQWAGGHDISGHVFLLILGSAMLWLELLPAVLRAEGLREKRRIRTIDGANKSAAVETQEETGNMAVPRPQELGIGVQVALGVAGLSWWMLLMTAAYFHTWFEKFTGLIVAFGAVFAVYFVPRTVPGLRRVVGMPGV